VCLAGEAGIGKSRLLLEMRRRLAEANELATWLAGRCVSFGQSIPFLPMIDQLRENFRIEEFDGEPEIIAKVEHAMRGMGQLEPHIPYIRDLLAVDPGDPAVAAMDVVMCAVPTAPARGGWVRVTARGGAHAMGERAEGLDVVSPLHFRSASSQPWAAFPRVPNGKP
jgi:hypothetical protein